MEMHFGNKSGKAENRRILTYDLLIISSVFCQNSVTIDE